MQNCYRKVVRFIINKKFSCCPESETRNGSFIFVFFLFSSMTSSSTNLFFCLCVALLIRDFSDCCTDSELVRGCRISTPDFSPDFQCLCGVGCHKEFPFKTRLECEASLKEGQYQGDYFFIKSHEKLELPPHDKLKAGINKKGI